MCGRYALHAKPEVVALQFALEAAPPFAPRYNIAPAAEILVVRERQASLARWNLRGRFVNLRAETVALKFKRSGRCLVPASGFYEWQASGGRKQPYYFSPRREPLFAFAALWEHATCALITTAADELMRKVHERMPLVVARERYAAWLGGDDSVLENPDATEMVAHPVSLAVNAAANDSPRLIEPVELARGLFD
jgi:putative SOS response-associated peptidase YedK